MTEEENTEIGVCPNCYAPLSLYPVLFDDDKILTNCDYCDRTIDITQFVKETE